ncbi:hypothetical protein FDUTEX481_07789 [Tolypothrix sp. PCC 7601]|nr:hypothetical protein FDUTEX481_07789 [Tolypothrix sp. PCC 7601]
MGIGHWAWVIGNSNFSLSPSPQSPVPNHQSPPVPNPHYPLSPEGAPSSPIPITPYPQRGPRVPQSPCL